jgi:predicted DNA-binding transcriptional regulator AlpA
MTPDRWLSADECAQHLGMTRNGKPNRRGFLERVACLPDFPAPFRVGQHRAWKLAEVDRWAMNQRKVG